MCKCGVKAVTSRLQSLNVSSPRFGRFAINRQQPASLATSADRVRVNAIGIPELFVGRHFELRHFNRSTAQSICRSAYYATTIVRSRKRNKKKPKRTTHIGDLHHSGGGKQTATVAALAICRLTKTAFGLLVLM